MTDTRAIAEVIAATFKAGAETVRLSRVLAMCGKWLDDSETAEAVNETLSICKEAGILLACWFHVSGRVAGYNVREKNETVISRRTDIADALAAAGMRRTR